ncbi:uncharacterized protein LOC121373999 [Gigantopelta aegis]|uniref:uncharacterized protein LOC121373999 n=1 Tax=Gigantopelta aegis TaxID=1735272 RepID=UPI001B888848|nr:uncharacterized protein LOC121373999 [Gigantopelta aegis]
MVMYSCYKEYQVAQVGPDNESSSNPEKPMNNMARYADVFQVIDAKKFAMTEKLNGEEFHEGLDSGVKSGHTQDFIGNNPDQEYPARKKKLANFNNGVNDLEDGFGDGISKLESGQTDPRGLNVIIGHDQDQQIQAPVQNGSGMEKPDRVELQPIPAASIYNVSKIINNTQFKRGSTNSISDFEQSFADKPIDSAVITDEKVFNSVTRQGGDLVLIRLFGNTVFLCFSPAIGFKFVIKLVEWREFSKRRQEVQIPLALGNFQWMVKLFGFGKIEHNRIIYAVVFMEYAGETLEKKTWSVDRARQLLVHLLQALKEMHELNIVHGDIKPLNLCWREQMVPVFIDWESAKNSQFPINFKGTANCNPPWFSQITALVRENKSCEDELKTLDLWAVGITVCCLINGTLPWSDIHCPTRPQLIEYIKEHHREIERYIPEVESPLREVIRGLLPVSGNIEDQISVIKALDTLQNPAPGNIPTSVADANPSMQHGRRQIDFRLPEKPMSYSNGFPTLEPDSGIAPDISLPSTDRHYWELGKDQTVQAWHGISMKFRNRVFNEIPVGMKFKDILNIQEIDDEIKHFKSDTNQNGWSIWLKVGWKRWFLNGSMRIKTNFEIDITPV